MYGNIIKSVMFFSVFYIFVGFSKVIGIKQFFRCEQTRMFAAVSCIPVNHEGLDVAAYAV